MAESEHLTTGQRVRAIRLQRGMSQRELAERMGWTPGNLSELECGKGEPLVSTVVLLCKALNTDPNALLDDWQ